MADINEQGTPHQGRIGGVSYYVRNGKLIARIATNMRSPSRKGRTIKNMASRTKMNNVIHAWSSFQGSLKGLFEPQKPGQTDYTVFLSVNRTNARVYLTKDESREKACVADNFCVAMGQLVPAVQVSEEEGWWVSDLRCGDLDITPDTSLAQLDQALAENNDGLLRRGDEVAFISLQQEWTGGTPWPHCWGQVFRIPLGPSQFRTLREITHSPTGLEGFHNRGGFLACPKRGDTLVAWARVRPVEKRHPMVTTQLLVGTPPLAEQFCTKEHIREALLSYGPVENEFLLDNFLNE